MTTDDTPRPAKKTTSRRSSGTRSGGRSAASGGERGRDFPDRIYAVASPPSVGGTSLFTPGMTTDAESVDAFVSSEEDVMQAAAALEQAGFEVLQATNLLINFAGPAEAFEQAFGAHLFTQERSVIKPGNVEDEATFIDNADTRVSGLIETQGSEFEELLEGVAIEEPYYLDAPLALPPVVDYWHLNVPDDVSVALNSERPHRNAITGKGIRVAMVDTGFQTHAFFTEHGYRVEPTTLGPGTADPTVDENGHGTGESANIFATAPDITLLPVKCATASGALVNVTAAFTAAAALSPHVITNSWGSSQQNGPLSAANQALAAAVAGAVASGIIVVFSAGNGGWGFPGQHPDVVSVGGVHQKPDGTWEASSYTSGFNSNIYPGRRVPDVSGLVGMLPRAMYIMLPLPAGCAIDQGNGGGAFPNGDETATDDGWAAFSGTSAAAPQIAGVCALIRQVCGRMTPVQVRQVLMDTARDVTSGTNHPNHGHPATVGPDLATGNGLVDAHRAVLIAKLRCIVGPVVPVVPIHPAIGPIRPIRPLLPFLPVRPVVPIHPAIGPVRPFIQPILPFRPPVLPFRPPVLPFRQPVFPVPGPFEDEQEPGGYDVPGQQGGYEAQGGYDVQGGQQSAPGIGISAEDLVELERYIIESDSPPEL
ncbi:MULTISPECIES: S8 family serine peptidase [unclassified Ornithinimicrobium]|uniref:S8 family serine peptidase n=1 Tax=unclassified Ornithinimicrobium TaxID=2615080 RepID=UPI003853CCEC